MPQNPFDRDTRDDRVIMLLNKLGEQLIRSEKERIALGNKLAKLEQQQNSQGATLEKVENVTRLVEDALAQQGRFNRKLEQVTQDKIRINRKLERIEEAVTQTRNALESKALVLLTDKDVAGESTAPQLPADPAKTVAARPLPLMRDTKFWGYAASMAVIFAITLMGGWAAVKLATTDQTTVAETEAPAGEPATETASASTEQTADQGSDAAPAASEEAAAEPAPAPAAEAPPVASSAASDGQPRPVRIHVGNKDEDAAESIDAAAAALNEISPAAGTSSAENVAKAAPAPTTPVVAPPRAAAKPETSAQADKADKTDIDNFVSRQRDTSPLVSRVQHDNALPPLVQEIEKKALQGVPEAQHDLAALYTSGNAGVAVDYKKAAFWFKEAAIGGIANARYNLGVMHQQGMGVPKDIARAMSWYRAAAKLNHPEAEYNLGIAYIEGVGASYSPQIAARYFKQAALGGVVEAAYNLGLVYENGLLGKQDKKEALYWYKRASERGNPQAQAALAQLTKNMKITAGDADNMVSGMHPEDVAPAAGTATAPAEQPPAAPAPPAETPDKAAEAAPLPASDSTASAADIEGPDAVPTGISSAEPPAVSFGQESIASIAAPAPGDAPQDSGVTAQIQEQLIKRGLYPGPADGVNSSQVRDAIRTYQTANNLGPDGRPTQALLAHMLSSEIKSPAKTKAQPATLGALSPGDMLIPGGGTPAPPVNN